MQTEERYPSSHLSLDKKANKHFSEMSSYSLPNLDRNKEGGVTTKHLLTSYTIFHLQSTKLAVQNPNPWKLPVGWISASFAMRLWKLKKCNGVHVFSKWLHKVALPCNVPHGKWIWVKRKTRSGIYNDIDHFEPSLLSIKRNTQQESRWKKTCG